MPPATRENAAGRMAGQIVSPFEFWVVEAVWCQTRKANFLQGEWAFPSMARAKNSA